MKQICKYCKKKVFKRIDEGIEVLMEGIWEYDTFEDEYIKHTCEVK